MTTASQPRRIWRPRFSMRSLLLAVVLVSLYFALVHSRIREGRRHEAIARQLSDLRCTVGFSHYEWVPAPSGVQSGPGGGMTVWRASTLPDWMEAVGWSRAVRRIERVAIDCPSIEGVDEALALLATLDKVPAVSIYSDRFTLEHLTRLTSSTRITSLYVQSMDLPRRRIPALSRPDLRWLCVCRTQFSNPAIGDLPAGLEYLDATRTRINDEGLPQLTRLRRLENLNLSRTPTSPEAIENLRRQMPWCEITWEPLLNP